MKPSYVAGVLTVYQNNGLFDYERLAHYTAKRAGKLYDLPFTSIQTETKDSYERTFPGVEGLHPFLNSCQAEAMEKTPFDVTIFMDADFVPVTTELVTYAALVGPANPILFLGRENVVRLSLHETLISDNVNKMVLWSTVMIYYMNSFTRKFFDQVKYVRDNWGMYAKYFDLPDHLYRNDYAFSIAARRMNIQPNWCLPPRYRCTFSFEEECTQLSDTAISVGGLRMPYDTHCMNKKSLLERINEADSSTPNDSYKGETQC